MQHRRQNTRHASLMTLDSQPGQPSRNRGADRRVEPQRTAAGLASIPDRDDLLRVRDRLALGVGARSVRFGSSRAQEIVRSGAAPHVDLPC
jgi:hypothetical protein